MAEPRNRVGRPGQLHGFVVIDKPAGWTSHDVVAHARRLLGERKIGHAGTLDPAATGVLPLAVGDATRVIEYLADATKSYLAEVTIGVTTDSYDGDGFVTSVADPSAVDRATIESALAPLRGMQDQVPPMHSAIKIGGKRLYDLARAGEIIERTPRPIEIRVLDLLAWTPPVATLLIDATKGTYVRSIARDLGDALGVGAYLSNLVRLRTGPFTLEDAVTLADLAELTDANPAACWDVVAYHPDVVLESWPVLVLDPDDAISWRTGNTIPSGAYAVDRVRAYNDQGSWLGVGRATEDGVGWRPTKVIGGGAKVGSAA